jgi:anti-sigma regulatory factor (Ser/Thr protein kinase)
VLRASLLRERLNKGGRPLKTRRLRRTFHNDPQAAWAARQALKELRGEIAPSTLQNLGLLVSEAVTNAVRHALCGPGTHVMLDVVVSPALVRVEVSDRGMGFDPAQTAPPDPETVGGWGLYLLEELADLWGVVHDEERGWTRVWFEIANNGGPIEDEQRDEGRVHRLPSSIARLSS